MATALDEVKDLAARRAEDAARHGYNGREGKGAHLLKECARAVRIAAGRIHALHNVPAVSADERAEYASELAARLVGESGGKLPEPDTLSPAYLQRRAQGIIMNDRARYGLDLTQPSEGEAGADDRLDGPLSIPAEIEAACERLKISETGKRALVALLVPATRAEWAAHWGYGSADSFWTIAKRGRAELRSIGPDAICEAIVAAEQEASDIMDEIERDLAAFQRELSHAR